MKLLIFYMHTETFFLPNSEALPDGGALPDSTRFFGQGFGGFMPIYYRHSYIYQSFIAHTNQYVITYTMII